MITPTVVRTPTQLGAALRRRRKALGWSQTELGDRVNVRQATISALERGASDARVSTLLDVLAILDLHLALGPRTGSTRDDEDWT